MHLSVFQWSCLVIEAEDVLAACLTRHLRLCPSAPEQDGGHGSVSSRGAACEPRDSSGGPTASDALPSESWWQLADHPRLGVSERRPRHLLTWIQLRRLR